MRHALIENRRLRTAVILSVALTIASFSMVWLIQPYMEATGVPTIWFGPVWAGFHVVLAATSLVSHRVLARLGTQRALLLCCGLGGASYVLLGATYAWFGAIFYVLLMMARGIQAPVLARVLQHEAPAADRAGILSLNSTVFRLTFAVLGPAIGRLVDRVGLHRALAVLAVSLTLATFAAWTLFARAHRSGDATPGS